MWFCEADKHTSTCACVKQTSAEALFICVSSRKLTQTLRVQLLDLDGLPKVSLATLLSDLKVNGVALQMSSSSETNEDQLF